MIFSHLHLPRREQVLAHLAALLGAALAAPAPAAPRKPAKKSARPAPTRKPNLFAGRVTSAAGQPLAGVTVAICGSTAPKHDSAPGVVKNFSWKIAGLSLGETPSKNADADTEARKYFGGYLYLKSNHEGFGGDRVYFPAGSTLVVTMTPRGPLIDSPKGAAKVFRRAFDKDVTGGIATHRMDVPVGLYALSASPPLTDGSSKPLGAKKPLDFNELFNSTVNVNLARRSSATCR